MALDEGKKAPAIKADTNGGGTWQLKDAKGSWVVLYFYPKDNTSGCTAEACDFRDNMKRLAKQHVMVVGVSPDSVKSHDNFVAKHDLSFTLLSDPEKAICEKYDCWKEKSMYGRKYMGVVRTTYLIDPNGKIVRAWDKVKVKGHVDDVIATLGEHGVAV